MTISEDKWQVHQTNIDVIIIGSRSSIVQTTSWFYRYEPLHFPRSQSYVHVQMLCPYWWTAPYAVPTLPWRVPIGWWSFWWSHASSIWVFFPEISLLRISACLVNVDWLCRVMSSVLLIYLFLNTCFWLWTVLSALPLDWLLNGLVNVCWLPIFSSFLVKESLNGLSVAVHMSRTRAAMHRTLPEMFGFCIAWLPYSRLVR